MKRQSGFTLIEILVAVSIFGIFVVTASTSLTSIMRQQQKTNVLRLTQQNTRNILESISREGRSSNGELDENGNRIAHAFSQDGDKLVLISTDMEQIDIELREVTKIEYFLENDVLRKVTYKKRIGENFSDPVENVGLNTTKDLKVVELAFVLESNPSDLDEPVAIKNLRIRSESGKGMDFERASLRANVELETSITSRGY